MENNAAREEADCFDDIVEYLAKLYHIPQERIKRDFIHIEHRLGARVRVLCVKGRPTAAGPWKDVDALTLKGQSEYGSGASNIPSRLKESETSRDIPILRETPVPKETTSNAKESPTSKRRWWGKSTQRSGEYLIDTKTTSRSKEFSERSPKATTTPPKLPGAVSPGQTPDLSSKGKSIQQISVWAPKEKQGQAPGSTSQAESIQHTSTWTPEEESNQILDFTGTEEPPQSTSSPSFEWSNIPVLSGTIVRSLVFGLIFLVMLSLVLSLIFPRTAARLLQKARRYTEGLMQTMKAILKEVKTEGESARARQRPASRTPTPERPSSRLPPSRASVSGTPRATASQDSPAQPVPGANNAVVAIVVEGDTEYRFITVHPSNFSKWWYMFKVPATILTIYLCLLGYFVKMIRSDMLPFMHPIMIISTYYMFHSYLVVFLQELMYLATRVLDQAGHPDTGKAYQAMVAFVTTTVIIFAKYYQSIGLQSPFVYPPEKPFHLQSIFVTPPADDPEVWKLKYVFLPFYFCCAFIIVNGVFFMKKELVKRKVFYYPGYLFPFDDPNARFEASNRNFIVSTYNSWFPGRNISWEKLLEWHIWVEWAAWILSGLITLFLLEMTLDWYIMTTGTF